MMSRRTLLQSSAAVAVSSGALAACTKETLQPFLTRPWTGPLDAPPLDKIRVADFAPAFKFAFSDHLKDVSAIAEQKAAPTFDNTIAALERSGKPLTRVYSLFGAVSGTLSDAPMQKFEQEISPKLAGHSSAVNLMPGLYPKVLAVHQNTAGETLTPEQMRVAERYETIMTRAGAKLTDAQKARVTELNQLLAAATTRFSQNQLSDEESYKLELTTDADLAGLPEGLKEAFRAHAQDQKRPGVKGLVANTRSAMEPFLTFSSRADLREKGWRMWMSRGDNNDAKDNKKNITEILALRTERARLLGYPSHAHYMVADSMAKTPEAALALLAELWKGAIKAVNEDKATYQAMATADGVAKIEPWDWRYYAEKVRKAKFDVNEDEVKPYLQLEKFQQATFWCAQRLYGVSFTQRKDIPVYHEDMTVWEAKGPDGATMGLFYFDPYAREGKNSGAWMNEIRSQQTFEGQKVLPLIVNCCNFPKPKPGEPALLSIDDARTTFHEFGHTLHGLLTKTTYPLVAGTNTYRDFVEVPSQINEHWTMLPEVLNKFAVHYKTGEPIPQSLVERITAAEKFNQGFIMGELLACAYVDMDIHMQDGQGKAIDPAVFEKESLARLGMPDEIVMRHRLPHFAHIFSSDGYSAGYYSYLWSQVLDNDGFAAFEEAGDAFDPATAKRFKEEILERGNSRDPAESYRAFRGRDPKIDALLRNRGFA